MTAREAMQPLPPSMELDRFADEALQLLRREGAKFLPVVAPGTGELVGVVLRRALEHGCEPMGHTPSECPLANHLKTRVDVCFEADPVEPLLHQACELGALRAGSRGGRNRMGIQLPAIVINQRNAPVGMIERDGPVTGP